MSGGMTPERLREIVLDELSRSSDEETRRTGEEIREREAREDEILREVERRTGRRAWDDDS